MSPLRAGNQALQSWILVSLGENCPQHLENKPCSSCEKSGQLRLCSFFLQVFSNSLKKATENETDWLVRLELEYLKFNSLSFPALCLSFKVKMFRVRPLHIYIYIISICFLSFIWGIELSKGKAKQKSEFSIFLVLLLPQNSLCTFEGSSPPFAESGICPNVMLCLPFHMLFKQTEILRLERTMHSL